MYVCDRVGNRFILEKKRLAGSKPGSPDFLYLNLNTELLCQYQFADVKQGYN